MSCYEPIRAWTIEGAYKENGKQFLTFQEPIKETKGLKEMAIPCGRCIGCRLDYSREWMARITKEASLYPNNAFLTLTYNNENLPIKDVVNKETGELVTGNPLIKEHIQQFIKKLRRQYKYHHNHEGIRFYACGEYGGRTQRPHYHIAIFNCDVTVWGDLELLRNNTSGNPLWTSPKIEKIWGKGFITIGDLTPESAGYIARYMLKKQKGNERWYYEANGLIPEYTTMSNKPGISRLWYEQHCDEYWLYDRIVIPKKNSKPLKIKTPAYYDKLLEQEKGIEAVREIKEARMKRAEKAKRIKMSKTTLNEWEQLKVEEAKKLEQSKKLIRPIEV